jgi:F420-non-reducing hydrogenase iron-sulfur subunit
MYLFYCATSISQAELLQHYGRHLNDMKVVPLPCSGKLDILYLTKAFDTGADGAAILVCEDGECRYMEGNLRAKKRAEAVDGLLQETNLGQGRITVISLDEGGIVEAVRKLEAFREHIAKVIAAAQ